MLLHVPVITIDGPSGSGKGTISQLLAKQLGWHYLDSGALYRVLAFIALAENMALDDEKNLSELAAKLPVGFVEKDTDYRIFWHERDIHDEIRTEECSQAASKVAALPLVRTALLQRQRDFQLAPGLVTDGRDMGTVVFPHADVKIFLEASPKERALRRYNQLQKMRIDANIDAILTELTERDLRDRTRKVAPLIPALDAILIDTSGLSIDQVIAALDAVIPKKYFGE